MRFITTLLFVIGAAFNASGQSGIVVFQTDFGLKDGAVAAMKGVAVSVASDLRLFDLTHEIPPYNIWEAALRLNQAAPFWPPGTVFISVVDPGVGSKRRSVVMKSRSGHFFVAPDNGTLTLVAETLGVEALRVIDESGNRLPGSGNSHTFHGRDVFAYTAARLASGKITYEQVGPLSEASIVTIPYEKPSFDGKTLRGTIEILDIQYGNVWTNISEGLVREAGIEYGDKVKIRILSGGKIVFSGSMRFTRTFADVDPGQPLAYVNSLMNFAVAINQGDFARLHGVGSGPEWKIVVESE